MIGEILIIHFDHFKFSNSKFSQFSLNDNDTFHSVFHESIVTLMFLVIILKLNIYFLTISMFTVVTLRFVTRKCHYLSQLSLNLNLISCQSF